ncbi:hypothetical protein HOY80DRAFT_1135921 [Tuber brumale]|nr:hypothetical protein HOY80DRAFT_1135921 [Tuber brumale]
MSYSDEFPLPEGAGLYASDISGDGNCLFHAPRDQNAAVTAALGSESAIDVAFAQRLNRMARPGVYGDNMEIRDFAREYRCDVKIYHRDFAYVVTVREGGGGGGVEGMRKNVLHIAYHATIQQKIQEVLVEAKGNIYAAVSNLLDAEEGGKRRASSRKEERMEETEAEKADAQGSSETQESVDNANNLAAATNSVKAVKRSAPKIGARASA